MNIVVATSRGKVVKSHLNRLKNNTTCELHSFPGAKLHTLSMEAHKLADKYKTTDNNLTIYFMGGLPNLTKRLKGKNYEEVIMETENSELVSIIMTEIRTIHSQFSKSNIKTVFCPVIPSNLEKWNQTRLRQHKTNRLPHSHKYPEMQKLLQYTVIELNREITTFNKQNKLATPFITTKTIVSLKPNCKIPSPRYKFQYINLPDGVHLNEHLGGVVAKQLMKAIITNQTTTTIQTKKLDPTHPVESDEDDERVNHSRHWRPQ